jgi:hypothetical protein
LRTEVTPHADRRADTTRLTEAVTGEARRAGVGVQLLLLRDGLDTTRRAAFSVTPPDGTSDDESMIGGEPH